LVSENFDYVIVGAGSAGCVLADRLTPTAAPRAGARVRRLRPLDFHSDALGAVHSDEHAEVQLVLSHGARAAPGRRRMHTPRGKVLGGSSSINGLVYIRGNAQDFERWAAEGAAGWAYRDVLPYFRRAETRAEGGNEYRGGRGKLQTCYGTLSNPLHAAWLAAPAQAGYPQTEDVNGFPAGRLRPHGHDGGRAAGAAAPPMPI
jgi:choline dehydrogenase